jgi:hypothetical protein
MHILIWPNCKQVENAYKTQDIQRILSTSNFFSEFHVSDGFRFLRFVAIRLTSEGRMRGNWIRNLFLKIISNIKLKLITTCK